MQIAETVMQSRVLAGEAGHRRTVLVTGGSSGIGRAMVRRFAQEGDRVWFTYRTGHDRALATVAELSGAGMQVEAFEFDQGNWPSHECLVAQLPGPVDVLVNNAAVGSKTVENCVPGPARLREAAFLRINSVGPLWLIQQLLPAMIERGYGKIINISSVGGGVAAFPGFRLADGMSKAAIAYLTRQLAAELVHQPIGVFAICPGAVATTMLEASTLAGLAPEQRHAWEARLPQRRLIQPAEIADVVWWLAGDVAPVLHGAVLDASMGLGVHPGLLTGDLPTGDLPTGDLPTGDLPTGDLPTGADAGEAG